MELLLAASPITLTGPSDSDMSLIKDAHRSRIHRTKLSRLGSSLGTKIVPVICF